VDVIWQLAGCGPRLPNDWFAHELMFRRREVKAVNRELGRGRHFLDGDLSWNQGCEDFNKDILPDYKCRAAN
jgi:hypothetical protein